MSQGEKTVTLSLISHTNVGKTTLARTLLRRDVGEVWDRPHVTDISEAYPLVETPNRARLLLWDTPGFGDTARLLRRLKISGNPIGWILSQVWDRLADRPFWCSQQAVRNVRDEADLVLYLVNAAEHPEEAGYVEMEMEILSWIGKPVLVLLNQVGPRHDPGVEIEEERKWREPLQKFQVVRGVLSFDAFARCWVQEGTLLERVGRFLPEEKETMFAELSEAWQRRNLEVFRESMHRLAKQLAETFCDREILQETSWLQRVRGLFVPLDARNPGQRSDKKRAMKRLAERLDARIRASTDDLIRLHGLEGSAGEKVLEWLQEDFRTNAPVDSGLSALLGGLFSGALGGLAADLAAGGLTFGGGAIVGGILGAFGAGGLSKGYNLVRGDRSPFVRWSPDFATGLVRSALLRYLAVAHFGRGRGRYVDSGEPGFWKNEAAEVVASRREQLQKFWQECKESDDSGRLLQGELEAFMESAGWELLRRLYPEAGELQAFDRSLET